MHIAGKDNVITYTLSHLIDINPDIVLEAELKDYEFGSYCFETLPKARRYHLLQKDWPQLMVWMYVKSVSHMTMTKICQILSRCLYLMKKFSQLQVGDEKIKNLRVRVSNGKY